MRKTPLRRVSKKHSARLKQYMKQRERFLAENPLCHVVASRPATEVHHMKGRGRYLLDESTWLAVSSKAHRWIHDHPKEAMDLGLILRR